METPRTFAEQLIEVAETCDVESPYGQLFKGLAPVSVIPSGYPE